MPIPPSASPVLVVGGRTTGIMMAAELARHGVAVRIIDKSPGIDLHCRATVLHSRSLEILDQLGIVDSIVACAQPLHGSCLYVNGEQRGRAEEMPVDSPFPHSLGLSQAVTEATLEQHLQSMGVTIERNTQLTAIEQANDRVYATLMHADGREETVETPWLVGCDGAHSTVRHLTEESFPGEADPYPYLLADIVVDGPLDPQDVHIFLHDEGDLFFFILNEGRRFVVANVPPESDLSQPPTLQQVEELVAQRSGRIFPLSDPRWMTYFHINYRLAPHYRHGRTFLAGDAAHVHSLMGGHGMNTGIQDAHNLAWKLALVLREVVPVSWLDTYETERRRVAEDVIALTKFATEQAELFTDLAPQKREELVKHMFVPESEKMRVRMQAEEIDLDYRASPICIEPVNEFSRGPHAGARAENAAPIFVDHKPCGLFDVLHTPKHSLILFAPMPPREASTDFANAVETIIEQHGHWIDVYVVADPEHYDDLPQKAILIEDRQQVFRERYGIDSAGCYLIRPDGYVAYRSRKFDSLDEYLSRVL